MAAAKRASRASKEDPFQSLARDGPAPLYAVDGVVALVDPFVEAVRAAVFPPGSPAEDFNRDSFSGAEHPLARVLDAAKTLPAFAPRRLVTVRRAQRLLEGRVSDADSQAFLAYVASPSPTTTLVLVADRKWDARTKLIKALNKAGALVRFEAPSEREMPAVLKAQAKIRGIKIEAGAVRALVSVLGNDLQRALESLELLELYVGPDTGQPIRGADVVSVISAAPEESVFEMVDSLADEAPDRALRGLYRLLAKQREPALRLLALLARHYRQLLTARVAERADLASLLGVPKFVAERLASQAARGSVPRFARALASIAATDQALKGGALDDLRAMERLVLHLRRDELLVPGEVRRRSIGDFLGAGRS